MTAERDALFKLATEFWRLIKTYERSLVDIPPNRLSGTIAQLRYSFGRLGPICQEAGLRLISYDHEPYEPNLPVSVSNTEDAGEFVDPIIERTLEPTIMADGQVVAQGRVILKERT